MGPPDQLIRTGGPTGSIKAAVSVKTHGFDEIVDAGTGSLNVRRITDEATDGLNNLQANAARIGDARRVADVAIVGGKLSNEAQEQIRGIYLSLRLEGSTAAFDEVVFLWL